MTIEQIFLALGVGGFSAIGGAFLIKTLVETGIKKTVELNFNKHLETYKTTLSKELESLKSSLKNSEVFFVRQLEALSMLRSVFRKILPKRRTPDMDWYEACEEIANSFSKHAERLHEYLCTYDAVLPAAVREKIEEAERIATDGTFQFNWNSQKSDAEPTDEAIKTAEELYNVLNDSITTFQTLIENQLGRRDET
jgi:hypothetical protein